MFKTRQPSAATPASNPPTVEWVRQRAKHRLLGVSVLVLAGVLLFPMLFDTQPRPIPVDIAIEIPSRQSVPPLVAGGAQSVAIAVEGQASTGGAAVLPPLSSSQPGFPQEEVIGGSEAATRVQDGVRAPVAAPAPVKPDVAKSVPVPPAVTVAPVAAAPKSAPEPKLAPEPKPKALPAVAQPAPAAPQPAANAAAEAARARALLEGRPVAATKPAEPAASGQRFIVQVGAFAESGRAQQVRSALERIGLKTYTHVADTPEGKRIRVRLGPFATRAEAEKAAAKAKTTGVPAAILTL